MKGCSRAARRARRAIVGGSIAAALSAASATASAQQIDVNPPLPNVLLMIDNSGSMERMIDGSLPESSTTNSCNCDPTSGVCNFSAQPPPNRWGTMTQALAGSLANGYNCVAMPRTPGSVFASEYQIGGNAPYDINYYIPFHRPVARDTSTGSGVSCVLGPGALPGASTPGGVGVQGLGAGGLATDFNKAIIARPYGQLTTSTTSCQFSQLGNGVLDSFRDIMRFGLMMFDTDSAAGIGVTPSTSPTVANPAFPGMWSYYAGWNTGAASPAVGNPANCTTSQLLEVGARNPAAPPWEGRMVTFPATTDITTQEAVNDQIQQVLSASRPYGATPLAGMFADAQYYLWTDPAGPQIADPYVAGGCRPEYVILLTDGAPNLDMRPSCTATGSPAGKCPYPLPETTAATLLAGASGTQSVITYVIGFAVSSFQDQGTTVYCSSLAANGQVAAVCSDPTKQALYGACCELQRIAIAGGTSQAYFADTPGSLQSALGAIFAAIAKNTTTRTTPAYSPVITNVIADPNAPATNESIFLASFNPTPGSSWSGDVQRQRYVCTYSGTGFSIPSPTIQTNLGDDFSANLNSNTGPARTFMGMQPDLLASGAAPDAAASIRPYVLSTVKDGLGRYSASTFAGQAPTVIASLTPAAVLPPSTTSCPYTSSTNGTQKTLTTSQCRDMLLDYTFAQQSFSGPSDFTFASRFGNALGDVFHATPTVVGPPSSLLSDDSYVAFRALNQSRKQIVYAATNDGLLHAFWADETKLENNELWAFLPPAVMPNLLSSYPSSHQFLLDGSPTTKDVVWDRSLSSTTAGNASNWHTTMVTGFGPSQRGYFAMDVSNPTLTSTISGVIPSEPSPTGPVFLWQLTKVPATNFSVFAAHSTTPAITTLFMDPGDGGGAREIGVAILPGGSDGSPTTYAGNGSACARTTKTTDSAPPSGYVARSGVRCWGSNQKSADAVNGRSLAIARLDTGEILRVFMRAADAPATDTIKLASRITDTPLDSPMTGAPMPYPADIGTDATKIFVGDADGTVWKFDVSSSDPTQWTGQLFLDLYNTTVDTSSSSWADGQPLEVPPVLSLDSAGSLVLNIGTGTQETYDTTGLDYVYSVSEKIPATNPDKLRAQVNWWLGPPTFQAGERVSGPMTVFDSVFYFSTFAAASTSATVCSNGTAKLWGRDFVLPDNTNDLSQGGARRLQPPPPQVPQTPPPVFVQPSTYDATLSGKVIPGVSIKATPACASLGTPGADQYVSGATHASSQNFTSGAFSLFTQVGATNTGGTSTGTTRPLEVAVPTPASPTVIDSWAAVVE